MNKITGNEPAMPTEIAMDGEGLGATSHQVGHYTALYHDLTIRQHYAGLAMQGFCAAGYGDFNNNHVEHIAKLSVKQADALIAELNKE